MLSACGGGSDTEEAPFGQTSATVPSTTAAPVPSTTAAPVPSTTAAPGPETIPPATTEPEVAPLTAAAPADLSSLEVYSLVAPSIPLIETPTGAGSGILIEGGYVVTNYHVVWPYHKAWVVFPDGTEFPDVPVLLWDRMADLAVLGPVGVRAPALGLVDGEGMDPGSEVHLIGYSGYSGDAGLFPQPIITSGVLIRFHEWDRYALTLLQTDAHIADGQSGGPLVNSSGDVVGIATWGTGDAGFSIATSAADSAEIMRSMLLAHEVLGGSLGPVYGDAIGAFEFVVELANAWDVGLYSFEGAAGSTVEVVIDGPGDGFLTVVGPTGVVMDVDDTFEGREYGIVELPVDGPYLVVIGAVEPGAGSGFTLTSSVELSPFDDPDDGQSLEIGEPLVAALDFHWDNDWYELPLEQGDTVVVWTEAIATDTAVYVGHERAGLNEMVWDDDSGPATVGNSKNERLYYTAPVSGTYHVVVVDLLGQGGKGYFVGVDYADDLRFDVGPGTTWRELFDAFEPAEQDCIRLEFGGGSLEDVLASKVLGEGNDDEFAGMLLCLGLKNATEAYISVLVGDLARLGVTFQLEDVACLREVFAEDEGAAFLTSLITQGELEGNSGVLVLPYLFCLPEEAFEEPENP